METITQILQGCIVGDRKYQKVIYERYRGFALKIVFRYIYRYENAVDVVNDGFVKAFNSFAHFTTGSDAENERILMGWLKRIMINASIDVLRKRNMIPEIGGIPDYVWEISDRSQDADGQLLYKELVTLIKELPPIYRAVFNLYVIDGYSHGEIADKLNIPVGTSKSTLSRARIFLRDRLKKMEEAKLCRI
ncbi:MAG: RNA polymerase sigma factor [Bacteroidota bacterium]|nr:RNA polymerase sigma factor [Bacteroidota bacterium]